MILNLNPVYSVYLVKKRIYLAKALSSQRKKYELYEFKIYGMVVKQKYLKKMNF